MVSFKRAVIWTSFLTGTARAIPTIHAKGAKLFDSNGNQFFIKGIAYQLVPTDPLLDVDQCTRDATLMATLGTNTIRVYHVDPSQSHDGCMTVFEKAGIYLWLDLDTFDTQIDQETSLRWNVTQYSRFANVMDSFAQYDNLAGFWIGNEVIRNSAGSDAAVYIKAATTDMKAYRQLISYRDIPIGYSATDLGELRPMLENYLACGDPSTAVEAFGYNIYEWCGSSTFQTSGYGSLERQTEGYSIPIFFSETGCKGSSERLFQDQASILGPDMDGTWSGAIIYEWIQEANNYGLVSYPGSGVEGTPSPIQPDFNNLMTAWKAVNPTGVKESDYTPSFSAPPCPESSNKWSVDGNPPLPTLGVAALSGLVSGSGKASSTASKSTSPTFASTTSDSSVEKTGSPSNSGMVTSTQSSTAGAATTSKTSAASNKRIGLAEYAVGAALIGIAAFI